jgi:hypothetical protein
VVSCRWSSALMIGAFKVVSEPPTAVCGKKGDHQTMVALRSASVAQPHQCLESPPAPWSSLSSSSGGSPRLSKKCRGNFRIFL